MSSRDFFSLNLIILVILNFSTAHFLFGNGNINNPEISRFIPALKDLMWISFVFYILFKNKAFANIFERKNFFIGAILISSAPLIISATYHYLDQGHFIHLSRLKNLALYFLAIFIFILALDKTLLERLIKTSLVILTVSLLSSLVVYFTVETDFKSSDIRMFGLSGNPNNSSFYSVILIMGSIILSNLFSKTEERILFSVGTFSLFYSASFFYILFITAFMVLHFASWKNWPNIKTLYRSANEKVMTVACLGALSMLLSFARFGQLPPFFQRISSLIKNLEPESTKGGQACCESVVVRLNDYQESQMEFIALTGSVSNFDSAFLTMMVQYGAFSITPYLFIFCYAIVKAVSHYQKVKEYSSFVIALTLLAIVSSLFHFQVITFPTNFLLFLLLATALQLIKKTQEQVPPHV